MRHDEFVGHRKRRMAHAPVSARADSATAPPESAGDDSHMSAKAGGRQGIAMLLLCIASLIAVEALLFARGRVLAGQIADAVLLFLILQVKPGPGRRSPATWSLSHALSLGWNPSEATRDAMRSLALVPLIRVVSVGLPLRDVSYPAGTLAVGLIIGSAAMVLAPVVGVAPRTFLTARAPRVQLQAVLGGLLLGFVAYLLGAPALWPTGASHERALLGLVAVVAAAAAEEIVFRGVVQWTLQRALGRAGVLAAAALFASTYLGAGSASLVLTVALAGLVFARTVVRTGGLSGAVGGHVVFAVGAGAIWPALLGRSHPAWLSGPVPIIALAVATAGMTAIIMRRHDGHEQSPSAGEAPVAPRLAQLPSIGSGLSVRRAVVGGLPARAVFRRTTARRSSVAQLSVQIIISNHNYGEYITEAIDSARNQVHPNVSIVVVDDGSTDDSRERLRRYRGTVDVVLKENGGQASAINAGLARGRADIVMLLDADDVLKPHAATRLAAAFASDPGIAKVQFRMDVIDARGRATGVTKPQPHIPMPQGDLRSAELAFPFDISWSGGGGNAFRTAALERILPIPEDDYPRRGADWYLVHLTTLLGPVVSLPDICASYRVHGRNGYEPRAPQLDLDHVRETIRYARVTGQALARLADELGLEYPRPILSLSELSNRLVSLKLEPELHPVQSDRAWRLAADAVRAAHRRFDVAWPMKAMFITWFAAAAAAPPPVARELAEIFMFPERRTRLNALLSRLHRGPGQPPRGGAD